MADNDLGGRIRVELSEGKFISLGPDEDSAIVRELAERGPFYEDDSDGAYCATCPPIEPPDPAPYPTDDLSTHAPSCLWRRARALYPKADT